MRSFAIDIYIWQPELKLWLWVPAASSGVRWPAFPGISRNDLLASEASAVFRVDDVLWLGTERDGFPLDTWVHALFASMRRGEPLELLTRLGVSEYLSFEIRQGQDEHELLISRYSTREPGEDYLERTARHTGYYYRDISVSTTLWNAAVLDALAGLRAALITCPPPDPESERKPLAKSIMDMREPE
jgi:hypothetical protein